MGLASCISTPRMLVPTAAFAIALSALEGLGEAKTFRVNSTEDEVDVAPGDGACETAAGTCTLRAAVQESNALPSDDRIRVPAGTYLLARGGAEESDAFDNLVETAQACPVGGDPTGLMVGVDAGLGALADNGGPTMTRAPLPDSPVLDTGDPASPGTGGGACALRDQRGVQRPLGGRCDLGAVEAG